MGLCVGATTPHGALASSNDFLGKRSVKAKENETAEDAEDEDCV
jgi:hypothetical protein